MFAKIGQQSNPQVVLQLISLPRLPYYAALLQSIDNLVIYKLCLKDANANANARTGKEKQPLIA